MTADPSPPARATRRLDPGATEQPPPDPETTRPAAAGDDGSVARIPDDASPLEAQPVAPGQLDPATRASLLPATAAMWDAFVASPLAGHVDWSTSSAALLEWIWHEDEAERGRQTLRQYRLTKGASGQPVVSPMAGYVAEHESKAQHLREHYGMTPRSRLALGADPEPAGEDDDELAQVERAIHKAARGDNVVAAVFWLEHKGGPTWQKATPADIAKELGKPLTRTRRRGTAPPG